MTWAGIKRGDDVIVVHRMRGRSDWETPGKAVSVGETWITVEVERGRPRRQRFQADNGHGEYGARVHTAQSLADEPRHAEASRRLDRTVWHHLPLATLEAVLRLVERGS